MTTLTIPARPQGVELDPTTTAVIVVDMQNDFGADGGMFQRGGIDISGIRAAVGPTRSALDAARRAGMKVVYLKMGFAPDLSDLGGEAAPNRAVHLRLGVGDPATTADGASYRILVRDTWGTEIVDDLKPVDGDLVVWKTRFSGFFETTLHDLLRELRVTDLVFTGCTSSICVESTLRDAFFRDYRCLVLEDCLAEPIGDGLPRTNHEATLLLVQAIFGAVSTSAAFAEAVDRA